MKAQFLLSIDAVVRPVQGVAVSAVAQQTDKPSKPPKEIAASHA
jgi:hypothetical protein